MSDTAKSSFSINVADYYSGDLDTLTTDNFLLEISKLNVSNNVAAVMEWGEIYQGDTNSSITKNYNQKTHILTCSVTSAKKTSYATPTGAGGYIVTSYGIAELTFVPYLVIFD